MFFLGIVLIPFLLILIIKIAFTLLKIFGKLVAFGFGIVGILISIVLLAPLLGIAIVVLPFLLAAGVVALAVTVLKFIFRK